LLADRIVSNTTQEENMKKSPMFVVFASVFVCLLASSALAMLGAFKLGADPDDPDTLYLVAGYPSSPDGDTLFFPEGGGNATIHINIWNDESIKGVSVPLTDLAYGYPHYAVLDSAENNGATDPLCFVGSRVEHFGFKGCNLMLNPPRVLYGAVVVQAEPLPPGDGLFARMVYTVEDTGTICLDTLFFPPSNALTFVYGLVPIGFTPQFVSRCFHLATYPCGDANGDRIVNIVDVVYIVNYLFDQGPGLVFPSDANCDGYTDIADAVYIASYVLYDGPPPCDPDDNGALDCS